MRRPGALLASVLAIAQLQGSCSAIAPSKFSWNTTDKMAIGRVIDCASVSECTTVAFGPSGSTKAVPKWHVQIEVLSMIYVKEPTYLSCSGTCADDIHQLGVELDFSKQNGYQDYSEAKTETINGTRVTNVYMNTGAIYGKSLTTIDETVKGGYVSSAWYLNSGNTTFQPQYNDFYVSEMDETDRTIAGPRVARGDSTNGAKEGPFYVCTSEVQGGDGVCGSSAFSTAPGNIKFSILGYHKGSVTDLTFKKGTNGIPAGTTHIGVRTKVSAEGIDITRMKLNAGEKSLSTIAGVDVTKLSLKAEDSEGFDMVFPHKYSIGNRESQGADAFASLTNIVPKMQREAKIKVHQGSGDSKIAASSVEKEVFIDYLFDASDFLDCGGTPEVWNCVSDRMYFVYDPTVGYNLPYVPKGDDDGTATTTKPTPPATTTPPPIESKKTNWTGLIVGLVFGFLIVAALIGYICYNKNTILNERKGDVEVGAFGDLAFDKATAPVIAYTPKPNPSFADSFVPPQNPQSPNKTLTAAIMQPSPQAPHSPQRPMSPQAEDGFWSPQSPQRPMSPQAMIGYTSPQSPQSPSRPFAPQNLQQSPASRQLNF